MNQGQKILFTDLDGTLLNDSKNVSAENISAIEQALKQGHAVVLTTGRPLAGTKDLIRELNLNKEGCYAITYNGGLIMDCHNEIPIFKTTIPLSQVYYIFEQAKKFGLHCQTYSDTHVLSLTKTPELDSYVKRTTVPCIIDPDFLDNMTEEPVKVLMIDYNNRQKLSDYRTSMAEWAKDKISMFFSSEDYLEHVSLGISKGAAITFLCHYLSIPLTHTIAIGDAENDIPMLQTAQIGAAMQNATYEVQKIADYITENDNNHSGVAEIIRKFML